MRKRSVIAGLLALSVVVPGCERNKGDSGGLPPVTRLERELGQAGWEKQQHRLAMNSGDTEHLSWRGPDGGGLDIWAREDGIVRLQLRGSSRSIETVLRELIPEQWEKIRELPGTMNDYSDGLVSPHVVDQLAVTIMWDRYVDGNPPEAFIIWPRDYYATEVCKK